MAFTFIASVLQQHKTARRIRSEARTRFPSEDWAEHRATRRFNLGVLVPLWVGIIIALCAAGYWFVPPEYATPAAIVIAVLVALLAWFMPGISPCGEASRPIPGTRGRHRHRSHVLREALGLPHPSLTHQADPVAHQKLARPACATASSPSGRRVRGRR